MKKTILIAASLLVSMAAYAQGTVLFKNDAATKIVFASTPDVPTALQGTAIPSGTTATPSGFAVALYWLNSGTGAFEQLGAAVNVSTPPGSGLFSGGERVTGSATAAGTAGTFMVAAWSGRTTYSSYEAALASGSADVYVGQSAAFSNGTGNPNGVPPTTAAALSGFTGMTVRPVPEPSIIALGLLGAAGLLIRRRN
jgi:hypothetical protein